MIAKDVSDLISVIIPAYNAEQYVRLTIESVCRQTLQDWELIIVDDGSQDNTAEIALAFANRDDRIRVIRHSNAGRSFARNLGFREASQRSAYVMFLDSDDELEDNALELLIATVEHDTEVVGAHGNVSRIDGSGRLLPWNPAYRHMRCWMDGAVQRAVIDSEPTTFEILSTQCVIYSPGCAVIKRSALNAAGLFDTKLDCAEDWDLWLRLTRIGPLAYVNKSMLRYRKHGDNTTDDGFAMLKGQGYVLWKSLISPLNDPSQRKCMVVAAANHWSQYLRDEELKLLYEIVAQRLARRSSAASLENRSIGAARKF